MNNAIDMDLIAIRLRSLVHRPDNANLSCKTTAGNISSTTDLCTVFLNGLGPLSSRRIGQSCDDLTSNDNTICNLGNT
jgi:hypothetical protein